MEVVKTSIQTKSFYRYEDASIMMDALNEVLGKLTAQKYIPKKQVAQANATFAAYNMLEKYPLFHYMKCETDNGKTEKRIEKRPGRNPEPLDIISRYHSSTEFWF